jgi:hypothetical protein
MMSRAKAVLRPRGIRWQNAMVADAVNAYFEPLKLPRRVRLHFLQDPVVALA